MMPGKLVLPVTLLVGTLVVFLGLYSSNTTGSSNTIYTFSRRRLQDVQQGSIEAEDTADETTILAALTEKLTPKPLLFVNETNITLVPHQFLHMHHMKTAGTSIDVLLRCAMQRLTRDYHLEVPYANIHECSTGRYESCKSGADERCRSMIDAASILSYCAPLKDLQVFGWDPAETQALTVLRDPIDRVWSMFRFQTKSCYKCKPLMEVYQDIDAGNTQNYTNICMQQLLNHETANLLSTEWEDVDSEEDKVRQAIHNMKHFFTMIGLTEQLETTVRMLGQVFPWMNETVAESNATCPLAHANASPSNNRCGANMTHWELPSSPDEETRKAIEAHNQMDMKLYAAALEHFEYQKKALGITDEV